jgi:hypothetical protein
MSRRFGNSPHLDSVDIGSVGLWGEWHFYDTQPRVPMPSEANARRIVDQYFEFFPDIPKVAQLQDAPSLRYAVTRGAGFRGDCWGNMNNQMKGLYPNNIAAAQAQDAWRRGPVMLETCWDISAWVARGFSVRQAFDWALSQHASAVHNKNKAVPANLMPEVERLIKRLGYRFVMREMRHASEVGRGANLLVRMHWDNVGVAPAYGSYALAFQLRNARGEVAHWLTTQNLAKDWLPGPFTIDQNIAIPAGLAAGRYTLALALVDPRGMAEIQLANSGRDGSGWYPLSHVTVE